MRQSAGLGKERRVKPIFNTNVTVRADNTQKLLKSLSDINLYRYPIKTLKHYIDLLNSFPLSVTDFQLNNVIYRIRKNKNSKPFKKYSDLSYPPKGNPEFQRASLPNFKMFYGAIIPNENLNTEINSEIIIAATEGSELMRNKEVSQGYEIVTFGKWNVTKPISLGTIIYPDIRRNITPYSKKRCLEAINTLQQNPLSGKKWELIMDFMASEFAKKNIVGDYDYLISALFTKLKIIDKELHGVIYPSVRAEEKGMNVAIVHSVVDSSMRLERVEECLITKKGKEIVIERLAIGW